MELHSSLLNHLAQAPLDNYPSFATICSISVSRPALQPILRKSIRLEMPRRPAPPTQAVRKQQLASLEATFQQEAIESSPNHLAQYEALAEYYRYLLLECLAPKGIDDEVLRLTGMLGRAFLVVSNIKRRDELLSTFDGFEDQSAKVMRAIAKFTGACNKFGWWQRGEMSDDVHRCFTQLEIEIERFTDLELSVLSRTQSLVEASDSHMVSLGRSTGATSISPLAPYGSSSNAGVEGSAVCLVNSAPNTGYATQTLHFVENQRRRAAIAVQRDAPSTMTGLVHPTVDSLSSSFQTQAAPNRSYRVDGAQIFLQRENEDAQHFLSRARPTIMLQVEGDRVCVCRPPSFQRDRLDMKTFLQEGRALLDAYDNESNCNTEDEDYCQHQITPHGTRPRERIKLLTAAIHRCATENRVLEGRWMIFIKGSGIDHAWEQVFQAVMKGSLGQKAEVKLVDPDKEEYILYVSTPNFESDDTVMEVYRGIRSLDWRTAAMSADSVSSTMYYKPLAYSALKIWSGNKYDVKPHLHTKSAPAIVSGYVR